MLYLVTGGIIITYYNMSNVLKPSILVSTMYIKNTLFYYLLIGCFETMFKSSIYDISIYFYTM